MASGKPAKSKFIQHKIHLTLYKKDMGKDDASGTKKAFTKAAEKKASATASVKDAGVTMILTSESGKMESATVRER